MTALDAAHRVALTDLVHRYAAHVDDGAPQAVAALFSEDGVLVTADPPRSLTPDAEHRGRAAITEVLSALDGLEATFHAVTGAVFDPGPEPGTASGRVSCLAHHVSLRNGDPVDLVWAVTYRDHYVLDDEDWRISRRAVHVTFVETRPLRAARTR